MIGEAINKDVNYVELKPRAVRNFYVLGHGKKTVLDEKGKKTVVSASYIATFENVTKLQAKNLGVDWAKRNDLTFDGVYSN